MNFTELFIRRPVMTTLVMAGILHVRPGGVPAAAGERPARGGLSHHLGAARACSGASPETMASSVATPLEKQFSTIPGMETMTSTSTQGSTSITLQFALSRNIDAAAQDVQAAISPGAAPLPQDMLPPSFRKVDPSSSPILYYALRTTTLPLPQLNEYAETFLAQRLSTVDGVAQVQVYGSQKYAVRIQLDPQQLAARNIGIDEVATAVAERQRQPPDRHPLGHRQGVLGGEPGPAHQRRGLRRAGRGLPRRRAGAPRRSGQGDGQRAGHQAAPAGSTGSARSCSRSSGSPAPTPWRWRTRVKAEVERLRPQMPPSVEIATLYDRSRDHQGVGERREVHPLPRALPGGDGDLPLPPESPRHRDPQPGAADVPGGHLRGDVPAGLQPGQSLADGAHAGRGLRGGRRHRGAGEHRAPHRAGRAGHRRRRSTGAGRSASPCSR